MKRITTLMQQPQQHGFTLIELLVVIAIIGTLAGLLVPAVGAARRSAIDTEDRNNLAQIGGLINSYMNDRPRRFLPFPPSLGALFKHDMSITTSQNSILESPYDGVQGDYDLNRDVWDKPGGSLIVPSPTSIMNPAHNDTVTKRSNPTPSDAELRRLYPPTSYYYECSDQIMPDFGWARIAPDPEPVDPTLADIKRFQLRFGNATDQQLGNLASYTGIPFPEGAFPIVRSFWRYQWTGSSVLSSQENTLQEVNNVSLNGNVFRGAPFWEHDVNPGIAVP